MQMRIRQDFVHKYVFIIARFLENVKGSALIFLEFAKKRRNVSCETFRRCACLSIGGQMFNIISPEQQWLFTRNTVRQPGHRISLTYYVVVGGREIWRVPLCQIP